MTPLIRFWLGLGQVAGFGIALAYLGMATLGLFTPDVPVEVPATAVRLGLVGFGVGAVCMVGRA